MLLSMLDMLYGDKVWQVSSEDLEQMHQKCEVGSEIDKTEEAGEDKRELKHPDSHPSKRQGRWGWYNFSWTKTKTWQWYLWGLEWYNVELVMIMVIVCTNT